MKREDLFIVSKLWQSFHDYDQVEPITRKQLADWGIDYFDLWVIHFPVALKYVDPKTRYPPGWYYDDASTKIEHSNARLEDTWRAMEDVQKKGLAKSIGISNYNGALLLDMFTYAKVKPATLQIEHHPYYVQPNLLKLAEQHGIAVTAYSSFGPQSFIECDMKVAADTPLLFDHPVITKIAEAHGKTPAQVSRTGETTSKRWLMSVSGSSSMVDTAWHLCHPQEQLTTPSAAELGCNKLRPEVGGYPTDFGSGQELEVQRTHKRMLPCSCLFSWPSR